MDGLDIGQFKALMEESQDLQVDAMRGVREPLDAIVEAGRDRRATREYAEQRREEAARRSLTAWGIPLAGLGALGVVGAAAGSAFAAADDDVKALQTAASLENLAVFTYKTALTLPYLKGDSSALKTVRAFAMMTMDATKQRRRISAPPRHRGDE